MSRSRCPLPGSLHTCTCIIRLPTFCSKKETGASCWSVPTRIGQNHTEFSSSACLEPSAKNQLCFSSSGPPAKGSLSTSNLTESLRVTACLQKESHVALHDKPTGRQVANHSKVGKSTPQKKGCRAMFTEAALHKFGCLSCSGTRTLRNAFTRK